ncbi:hypothetical protein ACFPRL_17290 [Pseudoclavibacter helvolus]
MLRYGILNLRPGVTAFLHPASPIRSSLLNTLAWRARFVVSAYASPRFVGCQTQKPPSRRSIPRIVQSSRSPGGAADSPTVSRLRGRRLAPSTWSTSNAPNWISP